MTDSNESIRELIASEVAHAEAVSGPDPSLSDFLLARIAEDEAHAGDFHSIMACDLTAGDWMVSGECDCGYPARVLAECETKRRIIGDLESMYMRVRGDGVVADGHFVLRAIALPYADHPDYREEWQA